MKKAQFLLVLMKYMKMIIILLLSAFIAGCDPIYTFQFVNQSEHRVCSFIDYDRLYPDTVVTDMLPLDTSFAQDTALLWQEIGVAMTVFETHGTIVDTLSVYVFDIDTIALYSWDTVAKNNMVLQRYDLSLTDLEGMSIKDYYSILYFPPTETMKRIHMWPPYGTYNTNKSHKMHALYKRL